MNSEVLFEAIGLADDELLKRCIRTEPRKKARGFYLAAALALPIIFAAFFIGRRVITPGISLSDATTSQELLSCLVQIDQMDTDGFSGTALSRIDCIMDKNEKIYVSFNSDTTFRDREGSNVEYHSLPADEWEGQAGDIVVVSFHTYTPETIYAVQVSDVFADLVYTNIENSFSVTVSETEKAFLIWKDDIPINSMSNIYLYNISEGQLSNITDSCEKGKSIPLQMTGTYIVLGNENNDFTVLSPDSYDIEITFVSKEESSSRYLGGGA